MDLMGGTGVPDGMDSGLYDTRRGRPRRGAGGVALVPLRRWLTA
jgi:hypothetical protein